MLISLAYAPLAMGTLDPYMNPTTASMHLKEVHTCDEWCSMGLCCECQPKDRTTKKTWVPNFRAPGPIHGTPGEVEGSKECMCWGDKDTSEGTCHDPPVNGVQPGDVKPSKETKIRNFLTTCCKLAGSDYGGISMVEHQQKEQQKEEAKRKEQERLEQEARQKQADAQKAADADAAAREAKKKPGAKVPCHELANEFHCTSKPSDSSIVYDTRRDGAEVVRGANAEATKAAYRSTCCAPPTCGILKLLGERNGKFNCNGLGSFTYKGLGSIPNKATTKASFQTDCCECDGDCRTCDEWESTKTDPKCTGNAVVNEHMRRSSLKCPSSSFDKVCCIRYDPGPNGARDRKEIMTTFTTCFGHPKAEAFLQAMQIPVTEDEHQHSEILLGVAALFSLFSLAIHFSFKRNIFHTGGDKLELLLID